MEAPATKPGSLPPSTRRKDKDKDKAEKRKDNKHKRNGRKDGKEKAKSKSETKESHQPAELYPSFPPVSGESDSLPQSEEGEFFDEKTERSISSPSSGTQGERGEEMGDDTGDEVDSFDEYIEDDDADAAEGGLYNSLSFLTPARSSGRTDAHRLSDASSRCPVRELTEERRREIEERALLISTTMGEARIIACQALWRRALCVSRFRILVRMNRKRATIMDELIVSEEDYVKNLTLAVDMYLKPLRDSLSTNEPILPSEMTLRSLFSDIEVIKNYNSALLEQVRRRHAHWGPYQKIGDVFVRMNHFLKAYSNYCKHYKEALITLGQLYRHNRFVAFLRKVAEGPAISGRTLEHFLALPVGRIPAYTDLLGRFAMQTWETHPDLPDLSEACDSLRELTAYVQDSRADVHNILTVLHIQNTLLGTDKNIVTLGRRLVREGPLEEVTRDGGKGPMWHLFLFNDLLLWTRPVGISYHHSASSSTSSSSSSSSHGSSSSSSSSALPSASRNASAPPLPFPSASSSSGGRSPTASPRRHGSWTSIFGSSEILLSRSLPSSSSSSPFFSPSPSSASSSSSAAAAAAASAHAEAPKYNVDMIDDLVCLSVSEVPLSHSHPEAEDDYGMYMVRGMTGATPVLLVARSARERKTWLQDLYSCIDDAVSKHYLRIGKQHKKAPQPVEEKKQVVHRELLGIMQLRKDEYFQYLRHSRSSAVPSHLNKKGGGKEKKKKASGGKRVALGRILPMGRRLSDATPEPPTRTTRNPLASVPLRQSIGAPSNGMDTITAASAAASPSLPVVGGGGAGAGDTGHHSKLHKSASVTQLDLLMAEMKNDPRAMIHLAPRLEHTMQRLNQHDWDDERMRKRKEKEREKEREKEKRGRGSKTGFKRSLSLKMRGEKKYDKDRIGAVDKETKDKEKDKKGKERERSGSNSVLHNSGDSNNGAEAEESEDGTSSTSSQSASINSSSEWDTSKQTRAVAPSASASSPKARGSGPKRKLGRERGMSDCGRTQRNDTNERAE